MAGEKIPGLGPRDVRPVANPHLDWSSLRLTPVEGFVLSRVDGLTSYHQIGILTGLPPNDTMDILRALKRQGLILNPGETPPPPPPAPEQKSDSRPLPTDPKLGSKGDAARTRQPSPQHVVSLLERIDDHSPVDPGLLVGGSDIDTLTKTRLVRLHRRLSKLSAAQLLGVTEQDGPKEYKTAYFHASKELHPDRYYGKDVGRFRDILEQVFRRCAEAFNELNEPYRRKKKS